ncbi:MAG: hypothetical protein Tsb0014_16000 [Pleurocapsa sp.]
MAILTSVTPKKNLGGTIRSRDPYTTYALLKPLLPKFGITRVADVTGLDSINIPVSVCIRPNGKSLATSQGKGISQILAKVSAIMESVETYHAENLSNAHIVGSYNQMVDKYSEDNVLNPTVLMPGNHWSRYSPDLTLDWLAGRDLLTEEAVYVPRGYVCLDTTKPYRDRELFYTSSNGLASGNSLAEAITHGLYEVIERDCKWRWFHLSEEKQFDTVVDNQTVDSSWLQSLIEKFEQAGVDVFLWDMTSEFGIPTYSCIIQEQANLCRSLGLFKGSGCHSSKEIALSRAMTEAAQSRLTVISGSRDDVFPSRYIDSQADAQIPLHEILAQRTHDKKLDFRLARELQLTDSFEGDLLQVSTRLEEEGFKKIIYVNHTKPEFGIPVVHVIVPGLRRLKD